MRYELTAKVEGSTYLAQDVITTRGDLLFEFRRGADNMLSEIVVGLRIPDGERETFASTIGPASVPGAKFEIKMGGDPQVTQRLMTELQTMESLVSFLSHNAVSRIRWDNVEHATVPESAEDEQMIDVFSIRPSQFYPGPSVTLSEAHLRDLVEQIPRYERLAIPQAFLREGWIHYKHFEYVLAFYKHYFVIEDFFANGKTSKREVLRAFAASDEFCSACSGTLKTVMANEHHGPQLRRLLDRHRCKHDVHGFQKLLFLLRGAVHHYTSRSTKATATPFNQDDFQTEALVLGILAGSAIASKLLAIHPEHGSHLLESWGYLNIP